MKRSSQVDEFFAALPDCKYPGKFDQWLKADPERAALFWTIMERAHAIGRCTQALKLWNERYDPCPVKSNQVRVRLNERQKSR